MSEPKCWCAARCWGDELNPDTPCWGKVTNGVFHYAWNETARAEEHWCEGHGERILVTKDYRPERKATV